MTVIASREVAVVSGVLNKHSIAYHIAKAMENDGIKVVYLVQDTFIDRVKEKRILPDDADIVPYDATNSDLVKQGSDYIARTYGAIDYLVHAVAFSDKAQLEGSFLKLTKENFINTMVISTFSFVEMCDAYQDILADNASVATLTFLGSQYVAANYGPMGIAKAALESAVRYAAQDLGPRGIRVNAIAPGPVKTLAASGIGEFDLSLYMGALRSATGKNATAEQVGRTTLKLMQCEGVTGDVLSVDNGTKLAGMGTSPGEKRAIATARELERAEAKAAKQAKAD
ncbi:MAG: NADH-specific enoyl-ACP reductase [Pseudomonas fluorescens]|nr:MAG: NADH-specific enoyl-ACP reductase [Pseudomonas fluorescens]